MVAKLEFFSTQRNGSSPGGVGENIAYHPIERSALPLMLAQDMIEPLALQSAAFGREK